VSLAKIIVVHCTTWRNLLAIMPWTVKRFCPADCLEWRDSSLKGLMKVFAAFVSAIAGTILIFENRNCFSDFDLGNSFYVGGLLRAISGILLLGGSITYFWARSRFYKG
jgi:hypothetical protein